MRPWPEEGSLGRSWDDAQQSKIIVSMNGGGGVPRRWIKPTRGALPGLREVSSCFLYRVVGWVRYKGAYTTRYPSSRLRDSRTWRFPALTIENMLPIMKLLSALITLLLFQGIHAQQCGWNLDGNDCICMNSRNGALMKDQTAECCKDMGLKINSLVGDKLSLQLEISLMGAEVQRQDEGTEADVQGLLQVAR